MVSLLVNVIVFGGLEKTAFVKSKINLQKLKIQKTKIRSVKNLKILIINFCFSVFQYFFSKLLKTFF